MQKNITVASVKYAALLLIEANEQVTTLEVKGLLRDLGYHALQQDVSEMLEQAAAELPLEFSTNGQFRTYTLPTPAAVVGSSDDDADPATATVSNTVSQSPRNSAITYQRRDGRVIVGSFSELTASDDDWVVSANGQSDAYFDGALSRDEVRQAYSKSVGVDFHNTRSSRYTK